MVASSAPPGVPSAPPRFFAHLAPGWALYSGTVLALSALTALASWLAQRGNRRIWGILVALGLAAHLAALALLWQRAAWRRRVRAAEAPAVPALRPALARVERRTARTTQGLILVGLTLFVAGLIGSRRTQGQPTML